MARVLLLLLLPTVPRTLTTVLYRQTHGSFSDRQAADMMSTRRRREDEVRHDVKVAAERR